MNHPSTHGPVTRPLRCMAVLAALAVIGCNGSSTSPSGGASQPSSVVAFRPDDPNISPSGMFLADANNAGLGQRVHVAGLSWGRLTNVYGLDGSGNRVLMQEDFVIGGSLDTDLQNYLLESNAVTGQQNLTILREVDTEAGLADFFSLLRLAENGLIPVFDQAVDDTGVFTMVPRNAVIVIQFDDLIDTNTVSNQTIRLFTGVPPTAPFEARVFVDRNHGDLRNGRFHPTRVIVDATVSEIESFGSDSPLPINGEGLPAAVSVEDANVLIRIPTIQNPAVGQDRIVRNLTDHPLATVSNGSVDFGSATDDVVRAMRSGGNQAVTSDPFNGFLPDRDPPLIVGSQVVSIQQQPTPISSPGDRDFVLPMVQFDTPFCAQTPSPGDVFQENEVFAQVIATSTPPIDGTVFDVTVRLLAYPDAWDDPGRDGPLEWLNSAVGSAQFLSSFDPTTDTGKEACFVEIFPPPSEISEGIADGITTGATIALRFSEPMDPVSLTAFDSMTLTREPVPDPDDEDEDPLSGSEYVVGRVTQSLDLQDFTYVPDLPLAHKFGDGSNSYYLTLDSDRFPPTDLAGNSLVFEFPVVECRVNPVQGTQRNGGRVSRFVNADEEAPVGTDETGPLPEWSGQHLYNVTRQLIRPRPLNRFDAVADRTKPVPSLMASFGTGVQTPLTPLGSKMQILWRYVDVGFSIDDPTNHNVDVEGLNWSPLSGQVSVDHFDEFEIRLSHTSLAPDEVIDPATLWPKYHLSGLKKNYDGNLLDGDPQKIVHSKFLGYTVNPGDKFSASTGTEMMPFPLNETVEPADYKYYTWRDTAIRERGGKNSGGSDPFQLYTALGIAPPANQFYDQNDIGTIGLPLLMEFRCYPDDGAQGLNSFDISIAVTSSSRPFFRAFSSGGANQSGTLVTVDPDLEDKANGGYNPTSTPPGQSTPGVDPVFYIGSMDLVTRVSRSYSIWFEVTDPTGDSFTAPRFNPALIEPRSTEQPIGTSVEVAFRGATAIELETAVDLDNITEMNLEDVGFQTLYNATSLDSYGDNYDLFVSPPRHDSDRANKAVTFLADDEWHSDVSMIDGALYYQVRVTFVANTQTGLTPVLSALALSWEE